MGALTSKPYAFTARPWELRNVETIDIGDTECVPVRVQLKGNQILRVLPLINNYMKSDWISDRARFSYDGFYMQRLTRSVWTDYFLGVDSQLVQLNWIDILIFLKKFTTFFIKFLFVIQRRLSSQEWVKLDKIASSLGQSHLIYSYSAEINNFSADLLPFFTVMQAESELKTADLIILIGLNLREQYPILYTGLRQRFLNEENFGYYYSMPGSLNGHFDTDFGISLGNSISCLWKIFSGTHFLSKRILAAKKPLILAGGNATLNQYFFNFMSTVYEFSNRIFDLLSLKLSVGILSTEPNHFVTHLYSIGLNDSRQYWGNKVKKKDQNYNSLFFGLPSHPINSNVSYSDVTSKAFIYYNIGLPKNFTIQMIDVYALDFMIYHSSHYKTESNLTSFNLQLPDFSNFEKSGFHYNGIGLGQTTNVVINFDEKKAASTCAPIDLLLKLWSLGDSLKLNEEFTNLETNFSKVLLEHTFLKNNAYKAQSILSTVFDNTLSNYDHLLNDEMSSNSPTLNLLKQMNLRWQLNFIN
jgi:hypothetical protein